MKPLSNDWLAACREEALAELRARLKEQLVNAILERALEHLNGTAEPTPSSSASAPAPVPPAEQAPVPHEPATHAPPMHEPPAPEPPAPEPLAHFTAPDPALDESLPPYIASTLNVPSPEPQDEPQDAQILPTPEVDASDESPAPAQQAAGAPNQEPMDATILEEIEAIREQILKNEQLLNQLKPFFHSPPE